MSGRDFCLGMIPVALVASSLNKPVIGYFSKIGDLQNKTKYTTLTRVSEAMSNMAHAIKVTLLYHKWSSVAIVRYNKDTCSVVLGGVTQVLQDGNITISNDLTIDLSSLENVANALMIIKMTARGKRQYYFCTD